MTAATNLQYRRARYYDPPTGRFLTADPLTGAAAQPQTLNRYAYALNNPTNRTDPTGLASEGPSGGMDSEFSPPAMNGRTLPIDEFVELWRSGSCGTAIRDLIFGVAFIAVGALMWTAPAPSLFLGGPAMLAGAALFTRGYLGYVNNC